MLTLRIRARHSRKLAVLLAFLLLAVGWAAPVSGKAATYWIVERVDSDEQVVVTETEEVSLLNEVVLLVGRNMLDPSEIAERQPVLRLTAMVGSPRSGCCYLSGPFLFVPSSGDAASYVLYEAESPFYFTRDDLEETLHPYLDRLGVQEGAELAILTSGPVAALAAGAVALLVAILVIRRYR